MESQPEGSAASLGEYPLGTMSNGGPRFIVEASLAKFGPALPDPRRIGAGYCGSYDSVRRLWPKPRGVDSDERRDIRGMGGGKRAGRAHRQSEVGYQNSKPNSWDCPPWR